MSTRSRIGIELKDGSILSAYHHWDGYPQWLGRILNTHYNSKQKVADLIDGGDMSAAWGDENRAEYYSERGEDCPLVMMPTSVSICSPIIVKNMLMSSAVVNGYAMICTSGKIINFPKLLKFPLEHLQHDY